MILISHTQLPTVSDVANYLTESHVWLIARIECSLEEINHITRDGTWTGFEACIPHPPIHCRQQLCGYVPIGAGVDGQHDVSVAIQHPAAEVLVHDAHLD